MPMQITGASQVQHRDRQQSTLLQDLTLICLYSTFFFFFVIIHLSFFFLFCFFTCSIQHCFNQHYCLKAKKKAHQIVIVVNLTVIVYYLFEMFRERWSLRPHSTHRQTGTHSDTNKHTFPPSFHIYSAAGVSTAPPKNPQCLHIFKIESTSTRGEAE